MNARIKEANTKEQVSGSQFRPKVEKLSSEVCFLCETSVELVALALTGACPLRRRSWTQIRTVD